MKKITQPFNSDIEVLRGVAIIFTLCSHLVWGLLPKLGAIGKQLQSMVQFWTGVDLFFAISGFIITSSLLSGTKIAHEEKSWSEFWKFAGPFWIRRVFRLFPSAWLWIAITLTLAFTFNEHAKFGTLHNNLREAGAALLNVANFYYYRTLAGSNGVYGSFGVFWSLSLEEQFYLVLPFLLFFTGRRLFLVLITAALLAQIFISRPDGFEPQHTSLLWFIRTDALILGVLIALWKGQWTYASIEPRFMRQAALKIPIVGGLIATLALLPAFSSLIPISTGLAALVSGVLVLIASYNQDYVLSDSLLKRLMMWMGSRSYSIYLIHVTCHSFIIEIKRSLRILEGNALSELLTLSCLPLILLLAELNYRLIEKPLREKGKRTAAQWSKQEKSLPESPAMAPARLLPTETNK